MQKAFQLVALTVVCGAMESSAQWSIVSTSLGNMIQDLEMTLCENMGNFLGDLPGHTHGCGNRHFQRRQRSVSQVEADLQVAHKTIAKLHRKLAAERVATHGLEQRLMDLGGELKAQKASNVALERQLKLERRLKLELDAKRRSEQEHTACGGSANVSMGLFYAEELFYAAMLLQLALFAVVPMAFLIKRLRIQIIQRTERKIEVAEDGEEDVDLLEESSRPCAPEEISYSCVPGVAEDLDLAIASDNSEDGSWSCVEVPTRDQSEDENEDEVENDDKDDAGQTSSESSWIDMPVNLCELQAPETLETLETLDTN